VTNQLGKYGDIYQLHFSLHVLSCFKVLKGQVSKTVANCCSF